jgi:hypothetical protein
MAGMPNQSYLSVWYKDFSEEKLIERYGEFLATVPFSATKPGFSYLTIRAVDPSESPVYEQDWRTTPLDPAGIAALSRDHLHSDCAYEARAHWDLWIYEGVGNASGRNEPSPVEVSTYGQDYDNGFWQENGHLQARLGFENLFVGHFGLLDVERGLAEPAESPEEARFLEAMAWPENLEKYQERTRENARRLMDWVRNVEKAIPDGRVKLWSEGEEDFETRLDEILAAR